MSIICLNQHSAEKLGETLAAEPFWKSNLENRFRELYFCDPLTEEVCFRELKEASQNTENVHVPSQGKRSKQH